MTMTALALGLVCLVTASSALAPRVGPEKIQEVLLQLPSHMFKKSCYERIIMTSSSSGLKVALGCPADEYITAEGCEKLDCPGGDLDLSAPDGVTLAHKKESHVEGLITIGHLAGMTVYHGPEAKRFCDLDTNNLSNFECIPTKADGGQCDPEYCQSGVCGGDVYYCRGRKCISTLFLCECKVKESAKCKEQILVNGVQLAVDKPVVLYDEYKTSSRKKREAASPNDQCTSVTSHCEKSIISVIVPDYHSVVYFCRGTGCWRPSSITDLVHSFKPSYEDLQDLALFDIEVYSATLKCHAAVRCPEPHDCDFLPENPLHPRYWRHPKCYHRGHYYWLALGFCMLILICLLSRVISAFIRLVVWMLTSPMAIWRSFRGGHELEQRFLVFKSESTQNPLDPIIKRKSKKQRHEDIELQEVKTSGRKRNTKRDNSWSSIFRRSMSPVKRGLLLSIALFSSLVVTSASELDYQRIAPTAVLISTQEDCQQITETEKKCSAYGSAILSMVPGGQPSWLMLKSKSAGTAGTLRLRTKVITMKCSPETLYFSPQSRIEVKTNPRCSFAGDCSSDSCNAVKPDSIPESLKEVKEGPGHSVCFSYSTNLFADGCMPGTKDGCFFARSFLETVEGRYFEVIRCSSWKFAVSVEVCLGESTCSTEILLPGEHTVIQNLSLTLASVSPPVIPAMSRCFLKDSSDSSISSVSCSDKNVFAANSVGEVQCPTKMDAKLITKRCAWNQGLLNVRKAYSTVITEFSPVDLVSLHSDNKIPLTFDSFTIEPDGTGGVQIPITYSALIQVVIHAAGQSFISMSEKIAIEMSQVDVSGCYSCTIGATLTYICKSRKEVSGCPATCPESNVQFPVSCGPNNTPMRVSASLKKEKINEHCTVTCGGPSVKFTMIGDLNQYIDIRPANNYTTGQDINDKPGGVQWGGLLGWFEGIWGKIIHFWLNNIYNVILAVSLIAIVCLVVYYYMRARAFSHLSKLE